MTAHARTRWTPRPKTPCRTAAEIRSRLVAGALTVIVDVTGDELLELGDEDFSGMKQAWTMRIAGVSRVRIALGKKLPRRISIVATDASSVQVIGFVEVHAYTNATVDAFDDCRVIGHNNVTVNACDRVEVSAMDNAIVNAYDEAIVHAGGNATVNATDQTRVILHEDATVVAQRGVTVWGPGRQNS